jgi:Leucine-rich repeat (LRR) protein
LEVLEVSFNPLGNLNENLFRNNLKLTQIVCMECHLTEIPSQLIQNLTQLVEIWFSDNQLTTIDEDFFLNNSNLKEIWFDNNRIEKLGSNHFGNVKNLRQIDFSKNELNSLNGNMFDHVESQSLFVNFRRNKCVTGFYELPKDAVQFKNDMARKCDNSNKNNKKKKE